MSTSEKQVRMAAHLYELRDGAKSFYGDSYQKQVAPLMRALSKMSTESGKSVLAVATEAAKGSSAMGITLLMAAVVELMEPIA